MSFTMKPLHILRPCLSSAFVLVAISGLVLFLEACDKKEPQDKKDVVRGQLISGTWKIKTLTIDGTDRTSLMPAFTLTFQTSAYATTNGGSLWPVSGTWSFIDEAGTTLEMSDIGEVHIESMSDTELILNFINSDSTFGPGRLSSIKGNHRFHLAK
jgi:hypothetical protein